MELHRAGFDVVGFDMVKQPRYPFAFVQQDALTVDLSPFDAVWASPPCQAYTNLTRGMNHGKIPLPVRTIPDTRSERLPRSQRGSAALPAVHEQRLRVLGGTVQMLNGYPDYIGLVRESLVAAGRPYIIENVVGAPLRDPILLCGSSFGLGVRRHRVFETSPELLFHGLCQHRGTMPLDVTGTGGPGGRHRKPRNMKEASEAMGIDWMKRREINQAIPPAYSEHLGRQLIKVLRP